MGRHVPGSGWWLRLPSTRPDRRPNGVVQTLDNRHIVVDVEGFYRDPSGHDAGGTLYLDRGTARLLAKRINQCLDATVSK